MRRSRIAALVLCMVCICIFTAAGGETLIQNFGPEQFKGYETFKAQYPEVEVRHASVFYANTTELSAAMVTRSMENDLLSLLTSWFDCRPIMEKGYCVDLSGYPEIAAAVNRMYPASGSSAWRTGKYMHCHGTLISTVTGSI